MVKNLCNLLMVFVCLNCYAFNLEGAWKLISIEKQTSNTNWRADCNSPTGLLIYTANGYMSASIKCMQNEKSFDNQDLTFYSGTYAVKRNLVTHHAIIANTASLYGKFLQRKIVMINNHEMYLVIENKKTRVRLRWEKIFS